MSRSRADVIIDRIHNALSGDPLYATNLLYQSLESASFGMVKVVVFFFQVADNDLSADMSAREVLARLHDEGIFVAFHKTRRREGERLLTVSKALNTENFNYTYGNLQGFTRLWLIKTTEAERTLREMKAQQKNVVFRH